MAKEDIKCPKCGKINVVLADKRNLKPSCGDCGYAGNFYYLINGEWK